MKKQLPRTDTEILIIGAGIVGLSIARHLALNRRGIITVLEQEPQPGTHASGRNSGVLHAGVYYGRDSLKAQLCLRGNRLMRDWLKQRDLPLVESGKLIGAFRDDEVVQLQNLSAAATANGTPVQWLSGRDAAAMAKGVAFCGEALFSPRTALFDPAATILALRQEVEELGVQLHTTHRWLRAVDDDLAEVIGADRHHRLWNFSTLINCAGAWADTVAHAWGAGEQYRMVPFRGSYRALAEPWRSRIRVPIYPVPDPALPFLGIHLTPVVDGDLLVGPDALPALGRAHYSGWRGIQPLIASRTALTMAGQLMRNQNRLRNHIRTELNRRSLAGLHRALLPMLPGLPKEALIPSGHTGIRAQLYHRHNHALEMDFVIEARGRTLHILNAVSPAFTSAFAFAEWLDEKGLLEPQVRRPDRQAAPQNYG